MTGCVRGFACSNIRLRSRVSISLCTCVCVLGALHVGWRTTTSQDVTRHTHDKGVTFDTYLSSIVSHFFHKFNRERRLKRGRRAFIRVVFVDCLRRQAKTLLILYIIMII